MWRVAAAAAAALFVRLLATAEAERNAQDALDLLLPFTMRTRHFGRFSYSDDKIEQPLGAHTGAGTIEQVLDHFSTAEQPINWDQHYAYNLEYAAEDSHLNFLFVSGESDLTMESITGDNNPLVALAKEHSAGIYVLEHRFYGRSRPTFLQDVASLAFLSSSQAVEDLAVFIRHMNDLKTSRGQKWIVYGGAYSGALALWLREAHPELVFAAIASSAPVKAQLDFYGYLMIVEENVRKFDAEQPKNATLCADELSTAFDQVQQLLQLSSGRAALDKYFGTIPSLEDSQLEANGIAMLYHSLTAPFSLASEYGGLGSVPSVAKLCQVMTDKKTTPETLKRLADARAFTGVEAVFINYTAVLEVMRQDDWNTNANSRSWLWQSCTEFGFFSSTDRGSNIFHSSVPINLFLNMCIDLFGVAPDDSLAGVERTNRARGGSLFYRATNVIATYGTADPWSELVMKIDDPKQNVMVIEIHGGVHCRDMMPADGDATVAAAQKDTAHYLNDFLKLPQETSKREEEEIVPASSKSTQVKSKITFKTSTESKKKNEKENERKRSRVFVSGMMPKLTLSSTPSEASTIHVREGTVSQPFDHFNDSDNRTFEQLFYETQKFSKGAESPNLLLLTGAEGAAKLWVETENLPWLLNADLFDANAFVLEHRYYGSSKLGTTSLKFLSIEQALFDVASFIETISATLDLRGPWIVLGGGYAGSLAAWSRRRFPDLVTGAVASSAPIEMKLDFFECMEVIQADLEIINSTCAERTKDAFDMSYALLPSGIGRIMLSTSFNFAPPWDEAPVTEASIQQVFSQLTSIFQVFDVDEEALAYLCEEMTSSAEESAAFEDLKQLVNKFLPEVYSNPEAENAILRGRIDYIDGHDPSFSNDEIAEVLWAWQKCSELGQFITTDYGRGIFSSNTPINLAMKMCEEVFDLSFDSVVLGLSKTRLFFGGRDQFETSNVLFVNGNRDPWHRLSLLPSSPVQRDDVATILINGTYHCADMKPESEDDPYELIGARLDISAFIRVWIQEARERTTASTVASSSSSSATSESSSPSPSKSTPSTPSTSPSTPSTPSSKTTTESDDYPSTTTSGSSENTRETLAASLLSFLFCILLSKLQL